MSTNNWRGKTSASDRISILPRDLREKILGYLPLRDAIRTSVLSRKWRYNWVVRSELVFDDKIDKGFLLKTFIYKVLSIHQGALRKFRLVVHNSEFFSDLDNWILFLSKKNIQELSLRFLKSMDFRLPSHLFKFQDLKHLELYSCEFHPPPNFKGFPSLVALKFQCVTFEPMSFQTFLSSSPLLERVTMICCTQFDSFIIEAPSLKFFEFNGIENSLSFKRTPLLEEFVLTMPFNLLKSLTVPEPQLTLHNIKILKLKSLMCDCVEWVAYALYLINRCPNLERLVLSSFNFEACVTHPLPSQVTTMTHSAMKRLKSVNMLLMRISEAEMDFFKQVLSSATALEKICIATLVEYSPWGMKMMEEMKQFPRASLNVEFIYQDGYSNGCSSWSCSML